MYALPRSRSRLCGAVDSAGRLSATLEERISSTLRVILSASLNYMANDYNFGMIVQFGPAADGRRFAGSSAMRERKQVMERLFPEEPEATHPDGRRIGWGNVLENMSLPYPDSRVLHFWRTFSH